MNNVANLIKVFASKNLENEELNLKGLTKKQVLKSREKYGKNILINEDKNDLLIRIKRSFINPFSLVLMLLVVILIISDIFLVDNKNYSSVFIILTMLIVSGSLRLIQELKSKNITDEITKLINVEVKVIRDNKICNLSYLDLVVGDIILLNPNDLVPADARIISSKDLLVSEAFITGESILKKKDNKPVNSSDLKTISDYKNTLFLGSSIISGSAKALVLAVGKESLYGLLAPEVIERKKGFDKGSNSIAWVLIKFMCFLVPLVFILSGITKASWVQAFLFAVSVAVGLTPELLPMVITACLTKGSYNMLKKQSIVKNVNAMQGFGNMDILCVDKTGTITNDSLTLEYYLDILGNESKEVLDLAYLNSYYHEGIKNHLDQAILKINELSKSDYYDNLVKQYFKVNELSFDYSRKISSVLLNNNQKNLLISKGSPSEILNKCNRIYYKGEVLDIKDNKEQSVKEITSEMEEDGMKVLAVAAKYTDLITDEDNLCLIGYLAFFDAPKKDATSAINKLKTLNVKTKVLTGDSLSVSLSVCKRLKMDLTYITGSDFDKLSNDEAQVIVEKTTIFAELSPKQKARIIELLKLNGHTVGFLGDGMNDLAAVLASDVGISVDTASNTIKQISDVILLEKDLNILEEGIIEGRKAFINMSKYIKITASSNLGNIIAIVIASIFLPFFPMTSIQILLLNLLYDILCLVLPWDNVDEEMTMKPLEWNGSNLSKFMILFGPVSSLFDIITFIFLYFFFVPNLVGGSFNSLSIALQENFISIFQTAWFLESMWTQIMILYLLRTKGLLFNKSRPAKPFVIITLLGIVVLTTTTISPLGKLFGLTSLPFSYFFFLVIIVVSYLIIITVVKKYYLKKFHNLI